MTDNHAPTLFPRITLDLEKVCSIENLMLGGGHGLAAIDNQPREKSALGWGYAIPTPEAQQHALTIGVNLYDYFTGQIAAYLNGFRGRKTPVLVWYANTNGLVWLHITSKKECRWMTIENSYDSHTQDTVPHNATPFVYLDGNGKIFRTYFCPADMKHENMLFDMGCFSPHRVGNAFSGRYDEIAESPTRGDNFYYSPIPQEREFVAVWKGGDIAMERAFCRISYRGAIFPHNMEEMDEEGF